MYIVCMLYVCVCVLYVCVCVFTCTLILPTPTLRRRLLPHTDLHPGNILVRLQPPRNPLKRLPYEAVRLVRGQGPTYMLEPHFVLLDVGMANWLTPRDQENMLGLFHGLVNLDGHDIGMGVCGGVVCGWYVGGMWVVCGVVMFVHVHMMMVLHPHDDGKQP